MTDPATGTDGIGATGASNGRGAARHSIPDPEALQPQPQPRHRDDSNGTSVPALARRLLDNATTLVRKELALATAEILQSVQEVKVGVGSMVSGAAVLYAGFLFLLLSAVLALLQLVPGWAAALIVGGTVTLIGFIMLQAGKSKVKPDSFAPERAAAALRKDKDMIGRQTS